MMVLLVVVKRAARIKYCSFHLINDKCILWCFREAVSLPLWSEMLSGTKES